MPVLLRAGLNNQARNIQLNKALETMKPKDSDAFFEEDIDMAIQSQVLSIHELTSLCML